MEPSSPFKRPKSIRAVIFDLDDTLVESTVDYAKFKTMVIERIVSRGEPEEPYSPKDTVVVTIARYEDRLRKAHVPEVEIRRRLEELDVIMDRVELERVSETKAIGGAMELLTLLRENDIKVGILTRGCDGYAKAALKTTRMLEFVDAIECRNSKTKPKPSPDAYLELTRKLGVRPEETVFVGDHPIDAQCAANAGVPFIAVRTGEVPDEELRKAGCVELFQDVGQMARWLRRILKSP